MMSFLRISRRMFCCATVLAAVVIPQSAAGQWSLDKILVVSDSKDAPPFAITSEKHDAAGGELRIKLPNRDCTLVFTWSFFVPVVNGNIKTLSPGQLLDANLKAEI